MLLIAVPFMTACFGCGDGTAHIDTALDYGLIPTESSEFDFGEQRQGEVLCHRFGLVNNTERTIKVVELRTSCQCVVAGDDEDLSALTILPRERLWLPVSLTTSGSQDLAAGRVVVRYVDATEEQKDFRGELALQVRASVLPDYRIVPALLDFGTVDGLETQTVTKSVRIEPDALRELKIESVRATSDFLEAVLESSPARQPETLLHVTLDVSRFFHSHSFDGMVILETNSERMPRGAVRVKGRYVAPIEAQPNAVIIPSTERGDLVREVRLTSTREGRIASVGASTDERLEVRYSGARLDTDHVITIVVSPTGGKAIDVEIPVRFELLPGADGGGSIFRSVTVPFHRLQEKGER